jgi:hypothetical protein
MPQYPTGTFRAFYPTGTFRAFYPIGTRHGGHWRPA